LIVRRDRPAIVQEGREAALGLIDRRLVAPDAEIGGDRAPEVGNVGRFTGLRLPAEARGERPDHRTRVVEIGRVTRGSALRRFDLTQCSGDLLPRACIVIVTHRRREAEIRREFGAAGANERPLIVEQRNAVGIRERPEILPVHRERRIVVGDAVEPGRAGIDGQRIRTPAGGSRLRVARQQQRNRRTAGTRTDAQRHDPTRG
jgi:hypothetical protein